MVVSTLCHDLAAGRRCCSMGKDLALGGLSRSSIGPGSARARRPSMLFSARSALGFGSRSDGLASGIPRIVRFGGAVSKAAARHRSTRITNRYVQFLKFSFRAALLRREFLPRKALSGVGHGFVLSGACVRLRLIVSRKTAQIQGRLNPRWGHRGGRQASPPTVPYRLSPPVVQLVPLAAPSEGSRRLRSTRIECSSGRKGQRVPSLFLAAMAFGSSNDHPARMRGVFVVDISSVAAGLSMFQHTSE